MAKLACFRRLPTRFHVDLTVLSAYMCVVLSDIAACVQLKAKKLRILPQTFLQRDCNSVYHQGYHVIDCHLFDLTFVQMFH